MDALVFFSEDYPALPPSIGEVQRIGKNAKTASKLFSKQLVT